MNKPKEEKVLGCELIFGRKRSDDKGCLYKLASLKKKPERSASLSKKFIGFKF